MIRSAEFAALCGAILFPCFSVGFAQPPSPPPQFDSVEIGDDRSITFRIHAPDATAVRLESGDLPGLTFGQGVDLAKGDDGVWKGTVDPLPAGAYRYHFNVDGVAVIDPRNTRSSGANSTIWSLAIVPGSDTFDAQQVPHGAVAEVCYYSESLQRHRRMHVYTPPGYEKNQEELPVFYLLHGATDSDDSWTTVG
ncbi:MAG: endo-1,4-beta-xylanase Z, partial [Planctomycetota bacterium]